MLESKYTDQESVYETQEFTLSEILNKEFRETSCELPAPPKYLFMCHSIKYEMERKYITLDTNNGNTRI